jgi:hypothetical protein
MAFSGYATAGSARVFGEIAALTERRVRHLRRAPGRLIGVALNPLVMLLAVGYLFRGAITAPGSRSPGPRCSSRMRWVTYWSGPGYCF